MRLAPAVEHELESVVGREHVLTDPDVTSGYAVDWTGRFRGDAAAVVRPADTSEVAGVLRVCGRHGVAVVPQGGNTGLVGGSVPLAGEIVLSLARLRRLETVDELAGQVTAGAGVPLAVLQRHVAPFGLQVGVDLAARDSATVGGMVATNAGGTRVLRHGAMRAQLVGCETVLADGSVLSHLGGLLKDNTGYDLAGLLCGSEGTLGVVTQVRLRLVPLPAFRVVALVAVGGVAAAVRLVASVRAALASLEAAELFLADGLELVCAHLGVRPPFPEGHPAYVVLECADAVDPTDRLAGVLAAAGALVRDAAVATDSVRAAELWRYREAHTEAINSLGVPHKLDVTLPPGRLPAFVDEVRAVVASVAPGARCFLFGHVGDGNVHVNAIGEAVTGDAVDDAVLRLVARSGGSISAEHGVGTAKRRWLHLNRSPAEIATFRRLKAALDPAGILNPNVLLP